MPFLTRWQIRWAGAGVNGSAASTLHYDLDGSVFNTALVTPLALAIQTALSDGLRKVIPPSVTIAVVGEVQSLNRDSGAIEDLANPSNGTAAMGGQGTGPFSSASGAVIGFQTASVARGRRVKGRMFCVPLAGDSYDVDGTLASGAVNFLQATGSELLRPSGTGASLVVYSRPPKGASTGGLAHLVTAATVRDQVAVLRSRRD